ncbi:hypothetical protein F4814DRAFT_419743 [Daldinia grandis]|nr:hypothetical protein F4814DRAFT_419743 [Daldinia grandis]
MLPSCLLSCCLYPGLYVLLCNATTPTESLTIHSMPLSTYHFLVLRSMHKHRNISIAIFIDPLAYFMPPANPPVRILGLVISPLAPHPLPCLACAKLPICVRGA